MIIILLSTVAGNKFSIFQFPWRKVRHSTDDFVAVDSAENRALFRNIREILAAHPLAVLRIVPVDRNRL